MAACAEVQAVPSHGAAAFDCPNWRS